MVGRFSKLDPRIAGVEEDTGDSVDPKRLLEPRETREVLERPTAGVLSPIPKEADTPKEAETPTAKEGLVELLGRAMMDV